MSRVLQFPEVVVVEASAGAGKTYALAKRYLKLLLDPNLSEGHMPLRSILAITFTNKATLEMKGRILEFLKRIALSDFSDKAQEKDIYDFLGLEAAAAARRARQATECIIKHYNFFQVQTIDSFINAILSGCALNIDRSANFKIKHDYSSRLEYCLDLVIAQACRDDKLRSELEQFLEHYLFVENRSGWFPKEDILALMHSLFTLSNKYSGTFCRYRNRGGEIIAKKKVIYEKIKQLSTGLPEGFNARAKKAIIKFAEESGGEFSIRALPKKFSSLSLPMNKNQSAPAALSRKWRRLRQEIKELVELQATAAYNPYVGLFNRLAGFFQDVSRREDVLFLEELNRKVRHLFDDCGLGVAELYYSLAARFRHYLIDEFQDTSILQWKNLNAMVEEALSTGGSLFYVGDKKQAIYRFRGGAVELFDDVASDFRHFNVKHALLAKNWRSQKEIVEFNNRVFSQENIRRMLFDSGISQKLETDEACARITDIFANARQSRREAFCGGYVRVVRLEEANQEERDVFLKPAVVNLIRELKGRFDYRDLAVLVRDNNEAALASGWLIDAGIPVESEKTLNILEDNLVKEIISLLTFLNSPIDDLSFAAFILGDVFLSASGLGRKEIEGFIFNLHKSGVLGRDKALYNFFRQSYPGLWDKFFSRLFKSVGFILPYELLCAAYRTFSLAGLFGGHQAFFIKLLEVVYDKESEYFGLEEVLNFLSEAAAGAQEMYVDVARSDAVKVLTIHKAKGLEFGVVIMPFFRMDITPETGGRGTKAHIETTDDNHLGLVRITEDYRLYSERLRRIYVRDYQKAVIDELNNVYVASTRAKNELYIFVPKRSGSGNNKAAFLIPRELTSCGRPGVYDKEKKKEDTVFIENDLELRDWTRMLDAELKTHGPGREDNVIKGNILHALLACVDNFGIEDAVSRVAAEYFFVSDWEFYRKKTEAIVNHPQFKIIFAAAGEVYCEKEVVNKRGDTRRIDRLIVKNKEVWVVDYKLSKAEGLGHDRQVLEYMHIAGEIYRGREVRGFLMYLDDLCLQEVKKTKE